MKIKAEANESRGIS